MRGVVKIKLNRLAEQFLLAVGLTILGLVGAVLIYRSVSSQLALAEFDKEQAAVLPGDATAASETAAPARTEPQAEAIEPAEEKVDVSLWSGKRIHKYYASLLAHKDSPIAVIRIEKLNMRVPVFEGTDDLVLNRGVGWIAGTARPGDPGNGNVGMAAHRDGFFRGLKDIAEGDEVELSTHRSVGIYVVDNIEIVKPEDVGVLRPRGVPSLTLVTCYPFYFVGDAPQRFIVHASLKRQVEVRKLQDQSSA